MVKSLTNTFIYQVAFKLRNSKGFVLFKFLPLILDLNLALMVLDLSLLDLSILDLIVVLDLHNSRDRTLDLFPVQESFLRRTVTSHSFY